MARVRGWLQGKKTMLGGLVLIAAGVLGVAFGKLPVDQAVIVVGFGISIAGWAAKADRHQQQILEVLTAVAETAAAYRVGGKAAAEQAAQDAIRQRGPAIVAAINEQAGDQGGRL